MAGCKFLVKLMCLCQRLGRVILPGLYCLIRLITSQNGSTSFEHMSFHHHVFFSKGSLNLVLEQITVDKESWL